MKKTYAVVLAISMAILWAGGCQEEQASSGDKMARLMAVENKELEAKLQAEKKKRDEEIKNLNTQSQAEIKKRDDEIKKLSGQLEIARAPIQAEITKRDDEIRELNAKFQAEIKNRDEDIRSANKQLEQCEKTRDERVAKEIDKQCQETVSKLMDWTAELSAENERLKTGQADVNGEPNK
jgi:Skp family chaperone for outer membrane proteins